MNKFLTDNKTKLNKIKFYQYFVQDYQNFILYYSSSDDLAKTIPKLSKNK